MPSTRIAIGPVLPSRGMTETTPRVVFIAPNPAAPAIGTAAAPYDTCKASRHGCCGCRQSSRGGLERPTPRPCRIERRERRLVGDITRRKDQSRLAPVQIGEFGLDQVMKVCVAGKLRVPPLPAPNTRTASISHRAPPGATPCRDCRWSTRPSPLRGRGARGHSYPELIELADGHAWPGFDPIEP
jgi:hypothetical protein